MVSKKIDKDDKTIVILRYKMTMIANSTTLAMALVQVTKWSKAKVKRRRRVNANGEDRI